MLKPTYEVALGTLTLASDHLAPLVALSVDRSKNAGADWVTVSIGRTLPSSGVPVSEGDPATVKLGWDGDTTLVFTGEVESQRRGVDTVTVTCAGSQAKLMRARSDRVFVSQRAGQVVSALAGDAGVDTDTVEDGVDLPVYLADSARRGWEHCLGLAQRCGFDLYANESGALVFSPFTTTTADATFHYGVEILAVSIERWRVGDGVAVVPESPASGEGDDASAWLVKDPSSYRGEAGGTATLILSDAALRTKDAADTAATARIDFRQRLAVTGTLELMGNPDLALGQAIALAGLPDDAANDTYQVLAVRHVLSGRLGFRTYAALGGMPGGGA